MNIIRTLLLLLSVLGASLFATAMLTSFLYPGYVEATAKEIIRRHVEIEVHERIGALDEKFLIGKAVAWPKSTMQK